jgi:hypothetical protein
MEIRSSTATEQGLYRQKYPEMSPEIAGIRRFAAVHD